MITGNEPAYPLRHDPTDCRSIPNGLTIRQYFAAMAMQGLAACSGEYNAKNFHEQIAKHSVMIADATINELNKIKEVADVQN